MLSLAEFATEFSREVRAFNALISRQNSDSAEALPVLANQLTRLIHLGENCPDAYNPEEDEPPDTGESALRKVLAKSFPKFGFYSVAGPGDENLYTADAIDDLADIHTALNRALWHIERGDAANAAWYAKLHFGHWGAHALSLKRYLHSELHGF